MNENEILDDLPYEEDQILSQELIDSIVACAKYVKYFVMVAIAYDIWKFLQSLFMISQFGSFNYFSFQSLFSTLISLISLYFLWQFAKTAALLDYMSEREFVKALQSLKLYFIVHLVILVFWKIIHYLAPIINQYIVF